MVIHLTTHDNTNRSTNMFLYGFVYIFWVLAVIPFVSVGANNLINETGPPTQTTLRSYLPTGAQKSTTIVKENNPHHKYKSIRPVTFLQRFLFLITPKKTHLRTNLIKNKNWGKQFIVDFGGFKNLFPNGVIKTRITALNSKPDRAKNESQKHENDPRLDQSLQRPRHFYRSSRLYPLKVLIRKFVKKRKQNLGSNSKQLKSKRQKSGNYNISFLRKNSVSQRREKRNTNQNYQTIGRGNNEEQFPFQQNDFMAWDQFGYGDEGNKFRIGDDLNHRFNSKSERIFKTGRENMIAFQPDTQAHDYKQSANGDYSKTDFNSKYHDYSPNQYNTFSDGWNRMQSKSDIYDKNRDNFNYDYVNPDHQGNANDYFINENLQSQRNVITKYTPNVNPNLLNQYTGNGKPFLYENSGPHMAVNDVNGDSHRPAPTYTNGRSTGSYPDNYYRSRYATENYVNSSPSVYTTNQDRKIQDSPRVLKPRFLYDNGRYNSSPILNHNQGRSGSNFKDKHFENSEMSRFQYPSNHHDNRLQEQREYVSVNEGTQQNLKSAGYGRIDRNLYEDNEANDMVHYPKPGAQYVHEYSQNVLEGNNRQIPNNFETPSLNHENQLDNEHSSNHYSQQQKYSDNNQKSLNHYNTHSRYQRPLLNDYNQDDIQRSYTSYSAMDSHNQQIRNLPTQTSHRHFNNRDKHISRHESQNRFEDGRLPLYNSNTNDIKDNKNHNYSNNNIINNNNNNNSQYSNRSGHNHRVFFNGASLPLGNRFSRLFQKGPQSASGDVTDFTNKPNHNSFNRRLRFKERDLSLLNVPTTKPRNDYDAETYNRLTYLPNRRLIPGNQKSTPQFGNTKSPRIDHKYGTITEKYTLRKIDASKYGSITPQKNEESFDYNERFYNPSTDRKAGYTHTPSGINLNKSFQRQMSRAKRQVMSYSGSQYYPNAPDLQHLRDNDAKIRFHNPHHFAAMEYFSIPKNQNAYNEYSTPQRTSRVTSQQLYKTEHQNNVGQHEVSQYGGQYFVPSQNYISVSDPSSGGVFMNHHRSEPYNFNADKHHETDTYRGSRLEKSDFYHIPLSMNNHKSELGYQVVNKEKPSQFFMADENYRNHNYNRYQPFQKQNVHQTSSFQQNPYHKTQYGHYLYAPTDDSHVGSLNNYKAGSQQFTYIDTQNGYLNTDDVYQLRQASYRRRLQQNFKENLSNDRKIVDLKNHPLNRRYKKATIQNSFQQIAHRPQEYSQRDAYDTSKFEKPRYATAQTDNQLNKYVSGEVSNIAEDNQPLFQESTFATVTFLNKTLSPPNTVGNVQLNALQPPSISPTSHDLTPLHLDRRGQIRQKTIKLRIQPSENIAQRRKSIKHQPRVILTNLKVVPYQEVMIPRHRV